MPVFNTAAHVIPAQPVSAYYEGKATRANIATQEIANEQAEELLDLDRRKVAVDEQTAETNAGNLIARIAEHKRALTKDQNEAMMRGSRAQVMYAEKRTREGLEPDPEGETRAFASAFGPGFEGAMGEALGQAVPTDLARAWVYSEMGVDRSPADFMLDGKPHQGSVDKAGNYYLGSGEPAVGKIEPFAVGRTEYDETPGSERQRGVAYWKAKERFDASIKIQEIIGNTIPNVIGAPKSVGGIAKIATEVAAVAEMFGLDPAGDAIALALTGEDQQALSDMRAQLRIIRGQVRPIVTGDYGARQSERELAIASEVVGLTERIESIPDLLRNYQQVMGSMQRLYAETVVSAYQDAAKFEEIAYLYDLTTDEGELKMMTEFSNHGINEDLALETLDRLEAIQLRGK
jgi:hypothetical protein